MAQALVVIGLDLSKTPDCALGRVARKVFLRFAESRLDWASYRLGGAYQSL